MMHAVGFNYPVDVSKLRVTKDSEPVVTTSIRSCSNSHRHKDGTSSVNGLESALPHKIPDAELSGHAVQQSRCQGGELSEQHDSKGTGCHSAPGAELVRVRRKAGRVSRCSNGSSKRSRVAPPEDTVNSAGVDDVKGVTDKSGSSPTKCNPPEKIQPAKQRHNFGGKRGERRNFKMSMKSRCEIFSLKSGFASFGGGVGGNNFFGAYGLKSDVQDITKFVDDVSLNELLDGTHECTSFGKEKGKKAAVMNGNFLDSVKKAWLVVPPQKAVQHQNISEIDNFPSKKFPTYPSSPVSLASHVNCEKEDCCPDDLSSSNKIQDSCGKPEMPATLLDFPLHQPKDVLEHLMLPLPKDLESLLLDAAKPSSSSRNTSDLRSGKQISRRPSLPPFPWSHSSNGHCRTNSDAVKCLTSRTTCQGRWVKIAKAASSPGSGTYSFTDLESLTYDQSLVPLRSKSGGLDNRIFPSTSSLPFGEWGSPSVAIDSRASQVRIESGSELKDQVNDAQCPRLLAAAQTLCDIATNPLRKNLNGFLRWPKKTPQKTMKARKSRLIEKSEEKYSTSLVSGSVKLVRSDVEHIMPLKRPKLSTAEKKKGLSHTTCVRRGTIPSPTPKSSRSSPGKSVRESILEVRHSPPTLVKQQCIIHLSAKQSA